MDIPIRNKVKIEKVRVIQYRHIDCVNWGDSYSASIKGCVQRRIEGLCMKIIEQCQRREGAMTTNLVEM